MDYTFLYWLGVICTYILIMVQLAYSKEDNSNKITNPSFMIVGVPLVSLLSWVGMMSLLVLSIRGQRHKNTTMSLESFVDRMKTDYRVLYRIDITFIENIYHITVDFGRGENYTFTGVTLNDVLKQFDTILIEKEKKCMLMKLNQMVQSKVI